MVGRNISAFLLFILCFQWERAHGRTYLCESQPRFPAGERSGAGVKISNECLRPNPKFFLSNGFEVVSLQDSAGDTKRAFLAKWHFEQSAIDLAKSDYPRLTQINVGIIDMYKSHPHHPEQTKKFLSGEVGSGVSTKVLYEIDFYKITQDLRSLRLHVKKMKELDIRIVNISVGPNVLSHDKIMPEFKNLARELHRNGIISVFSSGNHGKYVPASMENMPAILVGASNSLGRISHFSDISFSVDVLAPGRFVLGANGQEFIDGTSFSAPLVTGVISNMLGICRSLKIEEVRSILRKTSLPMRKNRTQREARQSFGLLNSYLAMRHAEEACRQRKGPLNLIGESEELIRQAMVKLESDNCLVFNEGLDQLRKSFFLSYNEQARRDLIIIYSAMGLDGHAAFYQSVL